MMKKQEGRKGQFSMVPDTFVYILIVGFFILFLAWAIVASGSDEEIIESEFGHKDADAILIGLLRTTVNTDLDGDGVVDAENVADLISLTDDRDVLEREIRGAMARVCTDEVPCIWLVDISGIGTVTDEEIQREEDLDLTRNPQSPIENFRKRSTSTAYIPRMNMEVVEVEFILYT